jgi:deoxycytidylate deaminase
MTLKRRYNIKATAYDKKNRVIAVGFNNYGKTHTFQAQCAEKVGEPYKQYLHAEISAIIKSKGKKIHTLKIERYDHEGNPKTAAPCSVCQLAIKEAGIRWVNYTVG